ncbi:hypothetical protein QQ045_011676 [Rhodiola kirilowii]
MVSLRFPFSFSQLSPKPPNSKSHFASRCITAVCVAAVGGTIAVSATTKESILQSALAPGLNNCGWASLSLANGVASEVKSKAGASFPAILGDSKRLLGVWLRRKNVVGLKNIDVYAFGILIPKEASADPSSTLQRHSGLDLTTAASSRTLRARMSSR